jgi:hypothetical protein
MSWQFGVIMTYYVFAVLEVAVRAGVGNVERNWPAKGIGYAVVEGFLAWCLWTGGYDHSVAQSILLGWFLFAVPFSIFSGFKRGKVEHNAGTLIFMIVITVAVGAVLS